MGTQNTGRRLLGFHPSRLQSTRPCPVLFSPHSRQSPVIGWTESPLVGTVICAGVRAAAGDGPSCGYVHHHPSPLHPPPTHFPVLPAAPVSFLGVPCLNSSYHLLPFFSLSLGFHVLTIPTAFFLLKFSLLSQKRRAELLRANSSAACGLFSPFRFWRPPGPGGLWDLAAWSQCPCLAGEVSKDCSCNPWAENLTSPKCPLSPLPALLGIPFCQWGNQEGLAGRDKVSSRRVRGWASRFGFLRHHLVSGLSLNKTASTDADIECLAHGHCGGHRQVEVITRGLGARHTSECHPTQWNDWQKQWGLLVGGKWAKAGKSAQWKRELGRTGEKQTESGAGDRELRSRVLCGWDLAGACFHSLGRRFGHSLASPTFCQMARMTGSQKARTTGAKRQALGGGWSTVYLYTHKGTLGQHSRSRTRPDQPWV